MIELLVVIAIIAILAAMLMPALEEARARARQAGCLSGLRQTGLGWAMYAMDHQEYRGYMGQHWAYGITSTGDTIHPMAENIWYPAAHVPAMLAVMGEGYASRGVMRCAGGDGGEAVHTQTPYNAVPAMQTYFVGSLWSGWTDHYFGTNTSANIDWATDVLPAGWPNTSGGAHGASWMDLMKITPCSYATNTGCSPMGHYMVANPGACWFRTNDRFIVRNNDSGKFFMAADGGRRQDAAIRGIHGGDVIDNWGRADLYQGFISDEVEHPNFWAHGARHNDASRNWLFLDGHAANVTPLPDAIEATWIEWAGGVVVAGPTGPQVLEHYFDQGIQMQANGYIDDVKGQANPFDWLTTCERPSAPEYVDHIWGIYYQSPGGPNGSWNGITNNLCGGQNWANFDPTP